MTSTERQAAVGLAGIFGLRMFGLFLVLPVLAIQGATLDGATPALIGLAIGAYGLTQALFQLPLGFLSDRVGRRPVIAAGLVLFAVGSVVAALSDHVIGVIIGRALQGSGAVAAAILALAADLTAPDQRSKTMAAIGMSVGAAFLLAMVLGPALAGPVGLAGLFWLSALLGIGAVAALFTLVPAPPADAPRADGVALRSQLAGVLRDPDLLRLDVGIFILHALLTAAFVAVPLLIRDTLGLALAAHWQVYVPVLLLSVVVLIPALIIAERWQWQQRVLAGAVVALAAAQLLLALHGGGAVVLLAALWLWFSAFNVLEATLPALISRYAPGRAKGTAMGVYATAQFAGAFAGGVLGGVVHGLAGFEAVFILGGALALAWLGALRGMRAIPDLRTRE